MECEVTPLDPDGSVTWLRDLFLDAHDFPHVVVGAGEDDCAVIQLGEQVVVLTTDYINAYPISLELGLGSLKDLGWYVVAANLSDLCGTGAIPRALLIGATLPRDSTETDLQELASGIRDAATEFSVPVIGGDTKLGPARAIYGVAVGTAASVSDLYFHRGAAIGDDIWLSGPIGQCAAAVVGLSSGGMDGEWVAWARTAVLRPSLPLRLAAQLAKLRVATAGIDLSDGLLADLGTLARASAVGVRIEVESLPIQPQVTMTARRLGVPDYALAMTIGGDLQFAVTAAPSCRDVLTELGLHRVGDVTQNERVEVVVEGRPPVPVPTHGHTDSRRSSFASEVEAIARDLALVVNDGLSG